MHLLLTDILTCPRCGPAHGLILLAHDLRDRRVHEGWLGCPNCRARWVVSKGRGEFRAPLGEEAPAVVVEDPAEAADAIRVAALLGVTEGPAMVLVIGPQARLAGEIAALVEGLEVVAVGMPDEVEAPGVSRMDIAAALPFYTGKVRAVWLGGAAADALLEEGARVLAPLGRLVLEPRPADADARIEAAGLTVIARSGETVVAGRTA